MWLFVPWRGWAGATSAGVSVALGLTLTTCQGGRAVAGRAVRRPSGTGDGEPVARPAASARLDAATSAPRPGVPRPAAPWASTTRCGPPGTGRTGLCGHGGGGRPPSRCRSRRAPPPGGRGSWSTNTTEAPDAAVRRRPRSNSPGRRCRGPSTPRRGRAARGSASRACATATFWLLPFDSCAMGGPGVRGGAEPLQPRSGGVGRRPYGTVRARRPDA